MKRALTAALSLPFLLQPLGAFGAGDSTEPDESDLDEVDQEDVSKPTEKQIAQEGPKVKEVVRGLYTQAILTDRDFLGTLQPVPGAYPVGATSSWGMGLRLGLGYDVVDSPTFGLAVEATYDQGAYNGRDDTSVPGSIIQGDFRVHGLHAGIRPAVILGDSRRWTAFARVVAGVLLSEQAVSDYDITYPGIHGAWHPSVGGGLGVEYYSKLSHFSFTFAEVEYLYVVGFDTALSVNFVGLKYTF